MSPATVALLNTVFTVMLQALETGHRVTQAAAEGRELPAEELWGMVGAVTDQAERLKAALREVAGEPGA